MDKAMQTLRLLLVALVLISTIQARALQFQVMRFDQLFEVSFRSDDQTAMGVDEVLRAYLRDFAPRELNLDLRGYVVVRGHDSNQFSIQFPSAFGPLVTEQLISDFAVALKTHLISIFPHEVVARSGKEEVLQAQVVEQAPVAIGMEFEDVPLSLPQAEHGVDLRQSRLLLCGKLLLGSLRCLLGGGFCPKDGMSCCTNCLASANVEHCPSCHAVVENAPGGPRKHCTNCGRNYLSSQQCNIPGYCCAAGCYVPLPLYATCGGTMTRRNYECDTCFPGCWITKH
jgi:hypothetical protein